ncbi:MAG: CatA-like O-acetyltransferase [Rikenellaceae bacterium]
MMGKRVIDLDGWKRKKKFEFFIGMLNPIYSITARVEMDNCYRAAKDRGRSLFIYYSYAIIKALNDVEELRLRINRESGEVEICIYDDVDLVSPIAIGGEGEFAEVRIAYTPDFEEFYSSAEQVISSVSPDMDPITQHTIDSTYAVVSALPFLDFTSISPTLIERGGVNQVPVITVGKICDTDGHKSMAIAIAIHHGLVDGYHVGQFFSQVQKTLDSY